MNTIGIKCQSIFLRRRFSACASKVTRTLPSLSVAARPSSAVSFSIVLGPLRLLPCGAHPSVPGVPTSSRSDSLLFSRSLWSMV